MSWIDEIKRILNELIIQQRDSLCILQIIDSVESQSEEPFRIDDDSSVKIFKVKFIQVSNKMFQNRQLKIFSDIKEVVEKIRMYLYDYIYSWMQLDKYFIITAFIFFYTLAFPRRVDYWLKWVFPDNWLEGDIFSENNYSKVFF